MIEDEEVLSVLSELRQMLLLCANHSDDDASPDSVSIPKHASSGLFCTR